MNSYKRWIYLGIFFLIFYYIFIVNFFIILGIGIFSYFAFKGYKFYKNYKLNKLLDSKDEFKKSELGLFVALCAKVAKADGRVHELEAQLISMMFDDISKLFRDKGRARELLKEIFNVEKQRTDDTLSISEALYELLKRSPLKRRQYFIFLIQLGLIDGGISQEEESLLKTIAYQLGITTSEYEGIVYKLKNKTSSNQKNSMELDEAYKVLGAKKTDDLSAIKRKYRDLVRRYHPDLIKSQSNDESYIEEATAKTQEINQAYQIIKEAIKEKGE